MDMARTILVLEDDRERVKRFEACFAILLPRVEIFVWRDAKKMVRECGDYLDRSVLICLDHDLVPEGGDSDPGDGLQVAKFLAPLRPRCPIVIHSSNADRAYQMVGEFQLHLCDVSTVLLLGPDWIEGYWWPKVKKLLEGA
jgi:hypothetical protein